MPAIEQGHARLFRAVPAVLAALLAGCGGASTPARTPAEAACRAEARDSPEVKALMQRQPGTERVTWRIVWEQEVAEAERKHTLDCLRRAGLALPGGVEAPAPRINQETLGSPLR